MDHKVDPNNLALNSTKYKNIFFFRVCGTGMGAAAVLLKDYGFHVEGGDHEFYPPMGTYIKNAGIRCHRINELKRQDYQSFDLIVVGNVVPKDSQDAKFIESLNIPYCSFSAAIGALILQNREVIGIAGTHGKTTTTYFAVQIFKSLGLNPGYLIGGAIENEHSSSLGKDKYFFIESDEYDSSYFEKFSKFHNYFIDHLILTSLEFDHADIFNNLEDIENEFKLLLQRKIKTLFLCEEYPSIINIANNAHCPKFYYGKNSQLGPKILQQGNDGTVFEISSSDQPYRFTTNVVGVTNILNLTSVILLALNEGFSNRDIDQAIGDLKFVKRRQELRGFYKGSAIIDDFAHHPKAVNTTIECLKQKYPNKKICIIIEPSSATARSSIFQQELEQSLLGAHSVAIIKTEPTSVSWAEDLDSKAIVNNLGKKTIPSIVANNLSEVLNFIDQNANAEATIAIFSNSRCLGLWESDFVKKIN